jgi:hypothetical protein
MSLDPGQYRALAAGHRAAAIAPGTGPALACRQYFAGLDQPGRTAGETWDALGHDPDGQYVTEISVPSFDDGRQALHSPGLSEPEPGS